MKNFNSTLRIYLFLAAMVMPGLYSNAQTVGWGSNGSDFFMTISWDSMPVQSFNCGASNSWVHGGVIPSNPDNTYFTEVNEPLPRGSHVDSVGPGITRTYNVYFYQDGQVHGFSGNCSPSTSSTWDKYANNLTMSTQNIHTVGSISGDSVITSSNIHLAKITWTKGSDVPDAYLKYIVYRGNTVLDTISSTGPLQYTDSTLLQTGSYTYYVTTYTAGGVTHGSGSTSTWTWAAQESSKSGVTIHLTNNLLRASDGAYYNKTQLNWNNIAFFAPNDIQISRNGQQILVVNKNTTSYQDYDGVPGVKYQYSVGPINANNQISFEFSDSGYSKPNGVLNGYVRSIYGSGVPNVAVTATGVVDAVTHVYSDSTDATGYYSINNIFYDTAADYTVTASRGTDQFNPPSITRNLNIQNYNNSLPDIDDTTVFTVSGHVTYAAFPGQTCTMPLSGAHLYINGLSSGDTTLADGSYKFTANLIGTYVIAFKYYDHTFNYASRSIYVSDNSNSTVDFQDTKLDTLVIDLKSGCNTQLCDSAKFLVQSINGCIQFNKHFNGWDKDTLVLPAAKYSINIPNSVYPQNYYSPFISTTPPYGQLSAIEVDLTHRDTNNLVTLRDTMLITPASHHTRADSTIAYTPADTVIVVDSTFSSYTPYHTASFIFHGPLSIQLRNVPTLCTSTNEYLVSQNAHYYAQIYVQEMSVYRNDTSYCYHDTGTVQIYDNVGGSGSVTTGQLVGGRLVYELIPGQPLVPDNTTVHQYEKLFNIYVTSGTQTANYDAWMVIEGIRTLTPTFNTTPQLPLMVLHDPPGSASYSSLEKDSSVSFNTQTLVNTTFAAGGQGQVMLGVVVPIPATGATEPGPYGNLQLQGTRGYSRDNNTSVTMTFTASQTISTSSDPNYVGFNGDVFIGASMNMKYSKAYELTVNSSCVPTVDTVLSYGIDSVATQFIYAVYDIQHTILPNLYSLMAIADTSRDSLYNKAYFQSQINVWLHALSSDSATIASFTRSRNISFTAGTSYDYSAVSDSNHQYTNNYALTTSFNQSFVLGISDGNNINVNAGDLVSLNTTNAKDTNGVTDLTTTYSYHLEDDVPGNYYTVDIAQDKHFGSPIFRVFAGGSACPWEAGTQPRDEPTMTIDPLRLDNIPATAAASFVAYLGNQSESNETRTYMASVAPETNPNGATIKIGGQDITQFPAYFTIAPGNVLPVVLTVEKGPFAADYNNIAINFGSSCDTNINVLENITVHFQNNCSDVTIAQPADGWLVNASSHDTLNVKIGGYDQSNQNFKEIGLQYRLVSNTGSLSAWSTIPATIIDSANITPIYTPVIFDVTNLPDGNYQLQAYARCGTGIATVYTYSDPINGIIDRHSFNLYGTTQPSNGILNLGENIGLQFNENIDCNQTYERIFTTLTMNNGDSIIPSTFTCYGNGLVLTTYPASLIDSLDGVTVTATVDRVHDINGNGLSSPISWSFLVSTSKIFWSPGTINATATLGTGPTITGTLENVGLADSFTVVHLPSWLTIVPPSSYHIAQGSPQSPFADPISFIVSSSLNQAHYADTVIILTGGRREYLYVNLDVVTQSPNWTVNPSNFQFNMNITANYSTTSLNAPLSSDTRDIIAAFVGNQCRGVGRITYDPVANTYSSFITAYSNNSTGDVFTFRMWDALPGIEYQAVEHLPFVVDGTIGQSSSPYILHPAGEFQTIDFAPGWNWFSLNVKDSNMSPANVLGSIRGNNSAVVKGQNIYDQYTTAANGWTGGLVFNTNSSYMINLDHADTLHFLGHPITDTSNLSIMQGWNWIGFPRKKIATASVFLNNVNASDTDILKSQTQYTQYGSRHWSGSLNYMYPGEGYRLKAHNAFNFVVPPDRSLPGWNANAAMFEQNMTVTADLQFDGSSTTQSHYLVGAFANGICVGTAQPEFLASLNLYRVFITIAADSSASHPALSFKVYDTDNDIEYVPTYLPVSVVPDTIVARVEAPYVINVQTTTGINALTFTDGFSLLQNVPNPFAKTTSIQYAIPSAQQVTMTLYDESGRLIRELVNGTQAAGSHTVSFEQDNLQSGVYFYQMKAGDFVKTRRMMILQQ